MFNILKNTLDIVGETLSIYSIAILSVIFSVILVFTATGKLTVSSGLIALILAGLVYILASSARGQNLEGSLPSVTYPVRNLGKDGISLPNLYPSKIRESGNWQPPY